ncbi:MAG TPA: XdhC family protein [Fimbriimonadaceae bacterium]|nr:XdhC family protein [Fimbriimonadaceae bacterium]
MAAKELEGVVAAWRALPPGSRAVLATVIATTGSTYRKAGARMLVTEAGWAAGSVSGGCLEGDVLTTAWERTSNGPTVVTYDSTADDDIVWGFGLGCQGSVTVMFERLDASGGPLPHLARSIEARESLVIATVVAGPELGRRWFVGSETRPETAAERRALKVLGSGECRIEEIDGQPTLVESICPPLALTVYGAGHDAIPLVEAAKALGWCVTVIDHRKTFAVPSRFPSADRVLVAPPESVGANGIPEPGSAVVVMTHNYLNDRTILGRVLSMPLRYVGQLGPRIRTDRMITELAAEGIDHTADQLDKLHAPIGLDLGGSTPEEVALSIVSEIQTVLSGKQALALRDRPGPLHAPAPPSALGRSSEPITCPASR